MAMALRYVGAWRGKTSFVSSAQVSNDAKMAEILLGKKSLSNDGYFPSSREGKGKARNGEGKKDA